MAYEATPARAGAIAAARDSEAFRTALRVAVSTRAAVLLVAIFAALSFGPASGGLARENAAKFDDPALTHTLADPLLAPLARWDSVWYLRIADSGYGDSAPRAAFFPLYPLLVRAVATPFGASEGALLVAAYARVARRVPRRARSAPPAHRARAGAAARAPNAAPARRVPGGRVLRRALLGEPLPAAGGGCLLCRTQRELGLGRGVRRARVGHAQRRPAAPDTAGDALVGLAPAPAARRRLAAARARSGSPPTPRGWGSWRATPCASSTSRTRGRAS